ncbi:hypothetical protein sscle_07g060950 [Sclerotinia sclerotiorum 1980 UF-70]|uniref:Major facilitator superfamily (MFS) profile domain-containing protein n=1 Tax=Sclerotinia sclerotiorum (strain ATCC 18683 / 1980 / Ss-1) TaxID=665079 RepID=A0A1D9Q8S3_SCLS1|nr:hypothetical protein sscle_07g060950 [Sclerotinia sclerotiorum 1980 UF-70]
MNLTEPTQSPNPEPTIVAWNGLSDPRDPFNWSLRKKWLVITLALLASFISSMNSTIISVAHNPINKEFGISDSHFPNSYWPIASWGVRGAIFSLVLFPVMEDFSIKPGETTTQRGKRDIHSRRTSKTPIHQILIKSVQRPLYVLFTESVIFIATLWAAFSLGTIYLFTQSVEQVYSHVTVGSVSKQVTFSSQSLLANV